MKTQISKKKQDLVVMYLLHHIVRKRSLKMKTFVKLVKCNEVSSKPIKGTYEDKYSAACFY